MNHARNIPAKYTSISAGTTKAAAEKKKKAKAAPKATLHGVADGLTLPRVISPDEAKRLKKHHEHDMAHAYEQAINLRHWNQTLARHRNPDKTRAPKVPSVVKKFADAKEADKFINEGVPIPEYKTGGVVKRTGIIKAHKGEIVVPKARVASVVKAVKAAGLKPLKK